MNSISTSQKLNTEKLRNRFPFLNRKVNNQPLIYFDNAATSQKPDSVIQKITKYYENTNANIHRGVHTLAEEATKAYEETRTAAQHFLHARHREEIVFTRGVTEGINLIAQSYAKTFLHEKDEILISTLEHHSNIVPWQMLCEEKKTILKIIPINDRGELDMEQFEKSISNQTKILAITHASNVLGTINPIKEMTALIHRTGGVVVVDGAQAAPHLPIDVQDLDVDFYCLSSHKMYGPTGVGILYGKKALLEAMPPYMGGGEMIRNVSFEKTTYNDLPFKFEAGTPHIAGTVALKEAINFIQELNREEILQYEKELTSYATSKLNSLPGISLWGTASEKVSVISFTINTIHHFDIGQILDTYGIAVRTGHHCAEPLMNQLGIEGTVRISFSLYNTKEEIDRFIEGMEKIMTLMR